MIVKDQDTQLQQSEDSQQSSRNTSIWRGAIIPFLATRLSLVLVGLLTDFYILPLLKRTPILPSPTANTAICQKKIGRFVPKVGRDSTGTLKYVTLLVEQVAPRTIQAVNFSKILRGT